MASGTASGQAMPGRSLWLDQALAPEQALPLALESSGALGVDLEQEKEREIYKHTWLSPDFPQTGKMPEPLREFQPMSPPSPGDLPRLSVPLTFLSCLGGLKMLQVYP